MAQLSGILSLERERGTMQQCRQIHLHLEGQFYHIYEWSAWLFTRYVQSFKLTHKLVSVNGSDILHDVLVYPIESKSPMESMAFLMELKSKIAKII